MLASQQLLSFIALGLVGLASFFPGRAPRRNPHYNESNYRAKVSQPAWIENR